MNCILFMFASGSNKHRLGHYESMGKENSYNDVYHLQYCLSPVHTSIQCLADFVYCQTESVITVVCCPYSRVWAVKVGFHGVGCYNNRNSNCDFIHYSTVNVLHYNYCFYYYYNLLQGKLPASPARFCLDTAVWKTYN